LYFPISEENNENYEVPRNKFRDGSTTSSYRQIGMNNFFKFTKQPSKKAIHHPLIMENSPRAQRKQ
jgi:hypothetical protein